ncbi:hypothetical protein B0H11DRAFT_2188944 [Mycena galericulata]|nr:hypothetical protein B0H11DRAFT_2188944 [Mycena galericulata]
MNPTRALAPYKTSDRAHQSKQTPGALGGARGRPVPAKGAERVGQGIGQHWKQQAGGLPRAGRYLQAISVARKLERKASMESGSESDEKMMALCEEFRSLTRGLRKMLQLEATDLQNGFGWVRRTMREQRREGFPARTWAGERGRGARWRKRKERGYSLGLSGNQQSWSLSKSEITGPREIEGSNPGKAAFRRVLVGITNLGRVPHCSAFAVRA